MARRIHIGYSRLAESKLRGHESIHGVEGGLRQLRGAVGLLSLVRYIIILS